ncbi:MAG: transposase [Prevotella sp.]|nr:transposase [Prevotella sp.]
MKLQKNCDIQPTLPLTEYDFLQKYRESFAVSELGRIHAMLPLKEMTRELAAHFPKKHPQGSIRPKKADF